MARATILHDMANGSVLVKHLVPLGHLNNLTGIMLGEIIHDALWASQDSDMRDHVEDIVDLKTSGQVTVPLYYVMLRTLVGEQSMNRSLSSQTLQLSASQVWAGIVSQFVLENLSTPTNFSLTANAIFIEPRLRVGLISLWMMVAGFVLLIILTAGIMFTTCNDVVPRDPGHLATSSSLTITSPTVTEVLSACGELRTSQISTLLSKFEFETKLDHSFRI